jgi:hypothetical protein
VTYWRPLERRYSSREPRPMNSVTRNILLRPFLSSMTRPSRRTRFSCCSDLKKILFSVAPVRNFPLLLLRYGTLLKCAIFLVFLRCGTYCCSQCCESGSGSTGSTCFWASRIRIRILLSSCINSKKIKTLILTVL